MLYISYYYWYIGFGAKPKEDAAAVGFLRNLAFDFDIAEIDLVKKEVFFLAFWMQAKSMPKAKASSAKSGPLCTIATNEFRHCFSCTTQIWPEKVWQGEGNAKGAAQGSASWLILAIFGNLEICW